MNNCQEIFMILPASFKLTFFPKSNALIDQINRMLPACHMLHKALIPFGLYLIFIVLHTILPTSKDENPINKYILYLENVYATLLDIYYTQALKKY